MPIAIVAAAAVVGAAAIGASGPSSINEQRAQALRKEAEKKALAESEEGFEEQQAALEPFLQVGRQAIGTLGTDVEELTRPFSTEDFQADPGFQFRVQQGERGVNNFLASRGLADSGRAGKELSRFNQSEATNEFDRAFGRFQETQGNRFNRLLSLANAGQNATNQLVGSSRQKTATNVNTILGTGNKNAASQSMIGDIENTATARRGDAIAGAAKSIGSFGASSLSSGAT